MNQNPLNNLSSRSLTSSLDEVLTYQNIDLISRFADDYEVSLADAEEIFLETKRWLWFCAKRTLRVERREEDFFPIPLFNEAYVIDLMWHLFILFTRDYMAFCEKYFGFYLHHEPKRQHEREAMQSNLKKNPLKTQNEQRQILRKVYESICEEFGVETLEKWCEEFPQRFYIESKRLRAY